MKKYVISLIFVFMIVLILGYPKSVDAKESLIIPKWVVSAQLLENGDLDIKEDITFKFNDQYNGVFREIVLDKTSGVTNIKVSELINTTKNNYIRVNNANKGDSNVFVIKEVDNKIRIQIFSPSEDEKKTFRIEYLVKNVAVKYNDTGELYYKFLGKENETPIEKFEVNIKLPKEDIENSVKVFAHGPLNGKINKIDNQNYSLYVEDVDPNTYIEGRFLFPREYIILSTNVKNYDNYKNILDEEAAYQNKIIEEQKQREEVARNLERISIIGSIVGFVLLIIFGSLFTRQDIKENKEEINIPDDCTPGIAAYLTRTYIGASVMLATILDLFRKEYIKVSGEGNPFKQDDQNYIITEVKQEDDSLLKHERYFKDMLFRKIGNGHTVSTKEIEDFSKNHHSEFVGSINLWKIDIKEDVILKGYYDKTKSKYGLLFLVYSLGLFLIGLVTLIHERMFGLASLGVSVTMFVYSLALFFRLSDFGLEQYQKWLQFKRNMYKKYKDISLDDYITYSQELSSIYALALGIEKKMDIDLEKLSQSQKLYYNDWHLWYFIFMHNSSFERNIQVSFQSNTATTSSGGGFTSGGGSGAGGGGAGGF